MKPVTCLLGAAVFIASCTDSNFVVDSSSLCGCSDNGIDNPCNGALDNWNRIVNDQMEVAAFDFKRSVIGTACEGETTVAWDWPPLFFNSWRPVTGYKQTLVGVLHDFNWNYDDDEDWNLHIVPDPPYRYLINDVETLHSESSDEHNRCGVKCMEGEISPDKAFWKNPFFFAPGEHAMDANNNGYSILEGRKIGMYGPWIMDANHDFKSEIHCANMIWWKDHWESGFGSSGPFDLFWLMLLQDNTGRFDDRDNFDCDGIVPASWLPWEHSPVSGQFSIAFLADPNGPVVKFEINEIASRFVKTSTDVNASRDADNGKEHGLEYQGKVLVTVKENQTNDDDLGVSFSGLCLRPDGKIQGYVTIKGMVGGNDDIDEEGYFFMYVTRSQQAALPRYEIPEVIRNTRLQTRRDSSTQQGLRLFLNDTLNTYYTLKTKDSIWAGSSDPTGVRSIQLTAFPSYIDVNRQAEPMDKTSPVLLSPSAVASIKWDVQAADFYTGKPVKLDIRYHQRTHKNDSLSINFPSIYDDRLIECKLITTIMDHQGRSAKAEKKYWNQTLRMDNTGLQSMRGLVDGSKLAAYNRVWEEEKHPVKELPTAFNQPDKETHAALLFRNFAALAYRDRIITVGELLQLRALAVRLGNEPH